VLNFNGIAHVLRTEHQGRVLFSLVGSVPLALYDLRPATKSDVMGGRAHRAPDGTLMAHYGRVWTSIDTLLAAVKGKATMCNLPGCACRQYF
jgi:hypothetical protein